MAAVIVCPPSLGSRVNRDKPCQWHGGLEALGELKSVDVFFHDRILSAYLARGE